MPRYVRTSATTFVVLHYLNNLALCNPKNVLNQPEQEHDVLVMQRQNTKDVHRISTLCDLYFTMILPCVCYFSLFHILSVSSLINCTVTFCKWCYVIRNVYLYVQLILLVNMCGYIFL